MSGSCAAERQMSERNDDHDQQVDELLCLSSVLSETEFQQVSPCSGKLIVHPICDPPMSVYPLSPEHAALLQDLHNSITISDGADTTIRHSKVLEYSKFLSRRLPDHSRSDVNSLPPVEVKFWFPEDYPSRSPPSFHISCSWLGKDMESRVIKHLVSLWKRNGGLAVLYDAFEDLKNIFQNRDLFPLGNILIAADHQSELESLKELRGNVVQVYDARNFVEDLRSCDSQRADAVFVNEYHQCPICCSNRPGSDFMKLCKCRHHCCRNCLRDEALVHISGGSIRSIRCLECSDEILPQDVQLLISSEDFEKYQSLQLNNALDTMGDIVYCPRPGCGQPVIKEPDSDVAMCTCGYSFCIRCKGSSHGVAPCQWNHTKIAELEGRLVLTDKDYVKQKLMQMITDARSEMWIENNAKHCPRCWAKVEKSGGCNHMSCQVCEGHFCWLCMSMLDKKDPYRHYNDPRSPCNQQLFERGEQEDDDVVDFVLEEGDEFNQAVEAVAGQLEGRPERWFDNEDMNLQARMILEGRVQLENQEPQN
ncbi:hypothetical protein RvY_07787 [Ramazzottius varieornatus]|uniref:RBR-type E3 ubiquitin transferase n=1 Tax=Ramazzottius varieornatus TaxID=947166 RepID=A0A1D1V3G2_RAMVA|nr:hypothetical protein RvY_07787 [Ramazzottius varieornatus]